MSGELAPLTASGSGGAGLRYCSFQRGGRAEGTAVGEESWGGTEMFGGR